MHQGAHKKLFWPWPGVDRSRWEDKQMITKYPLTNELDVLEYTAFSKTDFGTMDAVKACYVRLRILLKFSWKCSSTYTATRLGMQRTTDWCGELRKPTRL